MAQLSRRVLGALALMLGALIAASGGCGSANNQAPNLGDNGPDSSVSTPEDASTGDDSPGVAVGSKSFDASIATVGDAVAPAPTCDAGSGWSCAVDKQCVNPTTLTGKVFDPAGKNPLYNVVVFIPNDPTTLPAIQPGTHACSTCDVTIGDYIAATTTDAHGSFTLTKIPTGRNVPVVLQIGKWRRIVPVTTKDCATVTVPNGAMRLPRNRKEGDIPQMAILTGGCDDLGCFMAGMGLDPSEFSAPQGGGRLDVYQGAGPGGRGGGGAGATLSTGTAGNCTGAGCPLWASKQSLEYYDIVMLSCECSEHEETKPAAIGGPGKAALHDWLDEGGRVFASHYHYTWFANNPYPDFPKVANWIQGSTPANGMGDYDIDTTFPKGITFRDWLNYVGALNASGTITLSNVASSVSTANPPTSRWIFDPKGTMTGDASTPTQNVKYLSFATPVGGITSLAVDGGTVADAASDGEAGGAPASDASVPLETPLYCGKAVFTDLHTGGDFVSMVNDVPNGCPGGDLSAQEKALEFLFFDLSACVGDDHKEPPPPPPPPVQMQPK